MVQKVAASRRSVRESIKMFTCFNIPAVLEGRPFEDQIAILNRGLGLNLSPNNDPRDPLQRPSSPSVTAAASLSTSAPKSRSYPMNFEEVHRFLDRNNKRDPKIIEVLILALSNTIDGMAVAKWRDVRALYNGMTWGAFGRGPRSALHRSLRDIVHDPKAVLLWEGPRWTKDANGDWVDGELRIDGPAVETLRTALGRAES
jgi:hypothetical protein